VPKRRVTFGPRNEQTYVRKSRQGSRSWSGEKRRRRGGGKPLSGGGIRKEWAIAGLMGALVITAVLGLWLVGRKYSGGNNSGVVAAEREETAVPREKWHGPIPSVIAERFLKAKSQSERLELIRNPAEAGPYDPYCNVKFTVTVMMTGTGVLLSSVGVNSHCLTASRAA